MRSKRPVLILYGFALAAVVAGTLLRFGIEDFVGSCLPTYITFYPMVMVVALIAGVGPGLAATVFAALIVDFFVITPGSVLLYESPVEMVGQPFTAPIPLAARNRTDEGVSPRSTAI